LLIYVIFKFDLNKKYINNTTKMKKYSYEQCGKEFSQKSHCDSHKRRKTPCEKKTDKIKQQVDDSSEKKKMKEFKKKMKEFKNKMSVNKEVNTNNKMTERKIQKPFLKWIGGKTQIINSILDKFPNEIENYHELFLGGGSVLLATLSLQKQNKIVIKNKIYAYDINKALINVYRNIQKNKDELFEYITTYITKYDTIKGTLINRKPMTIEDANTSKESYYYWIRNKFNTMDKTTIEYSALFMFLNKTCFRGMYREGPNGYNVPYGHYKKTPTIITKKDLDYISDLIKDVIFLQSDFSDSIKNICSGDFVYLDPPYAPENETSFVGYTSKGFNLETHKKLFCEIITLNSKKIKFVMSNAKVDLVVNNFKDYNCEDIIARRAINSKKPGSTTTEVIIYN
jgi:DNA adenine methylase